MREKVILITGGNGEVSHGLIDKFAQAPERPTIVTLDLQELHKALQPNVARHVVGDILDTNLLDRLMSEYEISEIYHLAALLSTRAEYTPEAAHKVNVQGTINLLQLAIEQSRWQSQSVKFIFPSSIAVYGMPDLESKKQPVTETLYNQPITMYGCNKLYCEHLGRYYSAHYRQLSATPEPHYVDFRSLRFPGLISAMTLPTGGTSDYAPEMLHAAAQNIPYASFVRPDTMLPFMAMPDAIKALLNLAAAPAEHLTQTVYNVTSFSLSAGEIADIVEQAFPEAQITFAPQPQRQTIVDSWPAYMDDGAARNDWGWSPDYHAERAFEAYLIPTIQQRYTS